MKNNKNKGFRMQKYKMGMAVISIALMAGVPVYAAPRRDSIQSKGSINFEQGKVFLSAQDLNYLADQIDSLEGTYKKDTIDALNFISTYFKKDGSIVYHGEQNEVTEDQEKNQLSLSQIIQGIRQSQSLTSLEGIQAVNKEQQPLFYQTEEACNAQNHLEITENDSGFPLQYKAALEDNLSAGCAAWVNGTLIRGNGADNEHFREIGYREGYAKGVAEALGKVSVVYQYHEHEGEASKVGGCYGNKTGTRTNTCGCSSYAGATYGDGHATCGNCWHNHGGGTCNYATSTEQYTYIGLICNKTTETIESATIHY